MVLLHGPDIPRGEIIAALQLHATREAQVWGMMRRGRSPTRHALTSDQHQDLSEYS